MEAKHHHQRNTNNIILSEGKNITTIEDCAEDLQEPDSIPLILLWLKWLRADKHTEKLHHDWKHTRSLV